MFNAYTLKRLADERQAEILKEAEAARLARIVRGTKAGRPRLPLALAAAGAALAAVLVAFVR